MPLPLWAHIVIGTVLCIGYAGWCCWVDSNLRISGQRIANLKPAPNNKRNDDGGAGQR